MMSPPNKGGPPGGQLNCFHVLFFSVIALVWSVVFALIVPRLGEMTGALIGGAVVVLGYGLWRLMRNR